MKILLITGIYPPDIGGPATFIPRFARYLREQGHSVSIVTLANGESSTEFGDCKIIRITRNQNKIQRFLIALIVILKELNLHDCIFVNGLYEEAGIAIRIKKKRSVAKIVGNPIWEQINNKRSVLNESGIEFIPSIRDATWMRFQLLRYSLKQFGIITTPSEQLSNMINSWKIHKQVKVVSNGVKIDKLETFQKHIDIITVSRLVKWKNLDTLLEAIAGLSLSVAIVGSGPEYEKLREIALKNNMNVKFFGDLQEKEINQLLNLSRIFVQISDYEGMSFSLLKAMERSLACLVSDVPGNRHLVENLKDGLCVNAKSMTDINEKIVLLLSNDILCKELGDNARKKIISNFNENDILKTFEMLLEKND